MDWREKERQFCAPGREAAWAARMQAAIDCVEDSLQGEVDWERAARRAGCSLYHFRRIFPFVAGVSASVYLRRRRMSRAAMDLAGGARVLDVALRYGYTSPTAFHRAFAAQFGMPPSEARRAGVRLAVYPPLSLTASEKGATPVEYRMEKTDPRTLFGVSCPIRTAQRRDRLEVPQFWNTCREDGTIGAIKRAGGVEETAPLHAALIDCHDGGYTYMLCLEVPEGGVPEGFEHCHVPAGIWAVFPTPFLPYGEMASAAAALWDRIFSEWFPQSGFEREDAPELELHFCAADSRYRAEIWIPVKEKK